MGKAESGFPEMTSIYSSRNMLVRHGAGFGSSSVVITFAPWRSFPSTGHEGFDEAFLAALGIDAILVTCASNAWYQYEDMAEALAAIAVASQPYPQRVTYGSSMGAFAALAFSGAVHADLVLAISPQYSLLPAIVPFETRWRHEAETIRWIHNMEDRMSRDATCVVIYDNLHPDRLHVDLLSRVRPVTRLSLPFSGHPAGDFLKELGIVSRVVSDLLGGETSVSAIRQQIRKIRRQSSLLECTPSDRTRGWGC